MSKKIEAAISLKELFQKYAKRLLTNKVRPSISEEGIMTIPNNQRVEKMAQNLYEDFKKAGVPDDILKTENDIKVFHHKIAEINNENIVKQLGTFQDVFSPKKSADVFDLKGNKIKNTDNIMGGEGFIKQGDAITSENFGTSQFAPGNYSKTTLVKETDDQIIARHKKQNKESAERLKNKKDKPDDMATGGRAGYYGGGITNMVGEDLSEIGHGSDALMARNMQIAPNSMATTSTGLNYLLGQDNDTARVPYANGNGVADEDAEKAALGKRVRELMDEGFDMGEAVRKAMSEGYAEGGRIGYNKGKAVAVAKVVDKGRRGFMKTAGAAGAGIAALKTGLLGFADKAAPVVEKVAETAGQAPAYFLKLVEKIKNFGTDVTEVLAYKSRQKITKYKDYELTEDLTTGRQEIQRMKVLDDADAADYYGQPLTEETYMSFKPGKGQIDETMKGKTPPDEYEEGTALLRNDREYAGEVVEEMSGVSDDIFEEVGEQVPEAIRKGQAEGGRIGFESGKIVLGKNIYNLLKNNKKIKKAIDNIFGTGDYKYDAEMAAESLVELNPKEFNNMLYDDLPDNVRSEIYGAVIGPIQNNALIASRAKKTANTINISDPKVAEDFTNFMKNHGDPAAQKGIKELEETLLLSNAKRTKGRKDNSAGGIQTMLGE